ncbi:CEP126 isoform 3, partial [Pan troglodytes]
EQKRQNPGSVGQKYSEQINNFGQSVLLSSSEPKQTTRGTSYIEEDIQESICKNPSIKNTLQIIPLLEKREDRTSSCRDKR